MKKFPRIGRELHKWITALFILAFLLGMWGVLTIVSSQSAAEMPLFLAERQFAFLLAGLSLMYVCGRIPFRFHCGYGLLLLGVLTLAGLYMLPLFGAKINGMRGWYVAGSFMIQPSEFAKIPFLLLIGVISGRSGALRRQRWWLLPLTAAVFVSPILLQPDFGTATVYAASFILICFVCGVSLRLLGTACLAAIAVVATFILTHGYAMRRILAFLDPAADPDGMSWHVRQFQFTIANGGWFGTKLGNAHWSNGYLPLAYNDSAYATLSETLGFAGALPALAFWLLIIAVLLLFAGNFRRTGTAAVYCCGAGIMLAVECLLHVSVNVGLLPPTGLPLPLLSYGGSSLTATCLMLGIAVSAMRQAAGSGGCR